MALYFSARQVKLCHVRCAGAKVCAPACTLYYAYMFCLSRLFRSCQAALHVSPSFAVSASASVEIVFYEVSPLRVMPLFCVWIRGCATHGYLSVALRARGVCVFLRSCFIRLAVPFVLKLHTYCSSSSLTLVCLYAFKRSSLYALLCSFILYMHTYGFPFHSS